jgi:DNA-binding NarL/FixJ family response regulator
MTENEQRRPRLLLADDHLGILDEVRRLVTSEFDVLCTVAEGNALIQAVAELRPDAVISDTLWRLTESLRSMLTKKSRPWAWGANP